MRPAARSTLLPALFTFCLLTVFALLLDQPAAAQQDPLPAAAPEAVGATFVVNSTADLPDAVQDATCAAANGACTLRAAISTANFLDSNDTIQLPAGIYTIVLPGVENQNVSGDFDINFTGFSGSLTIQGAGREATVIRVGPGAGGRIFHVHNNALSLANLTLRDGDEVGQGGAILAATGAALVAPSLTLNTVALLDNEADEGGALFAVTVTANNILLRGNKARTLGGGAAQVTTLTITNGQVLSNTAPSAGALGGGLNVGTLTLTDATVRGNTAGLGGGGIWCGSCTLLRVVVENNQAGDRGGGLTASAASLRWSQVRGNSAGDIGGGLWVQTANLENSVVEQNEAGRGGGISMSGGTILASTIQGNRALVEYGGGISGGGVPLVVRDSLIFNNSAAGLGGGIKTNYLTLSGTTVISNAAGGGGGGVYIDAPFLNLPGPVDDSFFYTSTLTLNRGEEGGALYVNGAAVLTANRMYFGDNQATGDGGAVKVTISSTVEFDQVSFSGNEGGAGGAIANLGALIVHNSTLNGNSAATLGGAIANGGPLDIMNSTLSGNFANVGGGLYEGYAGNQIVYLRGVTIAGNLARGQNNSAGGIYVFSAGIPPRLEHTVIANNSRLVNNFPALNDCLGPVAVYAPSLIRTHSQGACPVTIEASGVLLTGSDPGLGPLADNGGWGLTHLPNAGAFVIDKGLGLSPCGLFLDQRGASRSGLCDLGAVERTANEPLPTKTPLPTFTPTPTLTPTPGLNPATTATFTPTRTPTVLAPTATATTPAGTPQPPNAKLFLPAIRKP